jgi:hypothetical protein
MSMSDNKNEFTTINVVKTDGARYYEQGIKSGKYGKEFSSGVQHNYNGYGGDNVIIPMQLDLKYKDNNGNKGSVSIKQEFRNEFSRITEKRLDAIKSTMPDKITLGINSNGDTCVDKNIMDKWIEDTNKTLGK